MNKIDMSCLLGTRILCEFWDYEDDMVLGFLSEVRNYYIDGVSTPHHLFAGKEYLSCKIYSNSDYWIANPDGKLVLPDGLKVNIELRSGELSCGWRINNGYLYNDSEGHTLGLRHKKDWHGDVIAIQVTGLASGWEY